MEVIAAILVSVQMSFTPFANAKPTPEVSHNFEFPAMKAQRPTRLWSSADSEPAIKPDISLVPAEEPAPRVLFTVRPQPRIHQVRSGILFEYRPPQNGRRCSWEPIGRVTETRQDLHGVYYVIEPL